MEFERRPKERRMTAHALHAHDAYRFSLGAAKSLNSFVFVPAIDNRAVNRAWARRRDRDPAESRRIVEQIEDFLARYFATGCLDAG